MKPDFPRLTRVRGAYCALAIVFVITATVFAQFGTFDPAFEGELWGVRHSLALPNNGVPAGVVFLNGTLYVADVENQTLVAYNGTGGVVGTIALSPVSGMIPHQLATAVVRRNGADINAILVSDKASNRVAAFDEAGDHLFTLRLTRPGILPTLLLSINQMAMAPGSRFNLTTNVQPTLSTLTLTGTFAAGWFEQLMTGPVNSGTLAYQDNPAFVNVAGLEFAVTATEVLTGTESDPVAPQPINMFGVAFDQAGNLYVLDAFTERLNAYAPDLTHLFTFGTPVPDWTTSEFNEPWGMAFWPDATGTSGRLFIGDTYKNRILVYRPVDNEGADGIVDGLQQETVINNFPLDLDAIDRLSLAVDSSQGRIAVTDLDSLAFVLGTRRLTAFNLQTLDENNAPIESVCTAANYRVRFSLTVPSGFASVNGFAPTLTVNGAPAAAAPVASDTYAGAMKAGDVATYTYSLTAPGTVADIELFASATASNTTDILGRAYVLSVADCAAETDPSTITAVPMRQPQVSGWTPVFDGETFSVALHAQDDDGIETIAYKLEGANESGEEPFATDYDGVVTTAVLGVDIPEFGRTTLHYRMRDGNGIWSPWQSLGVRTKLVVDRTTNENSPEEFRVGDPEGVGFTYSVNRLPDGVTFSTATGQFAGTPSYDAHQPYLIDDPVVASGVYNVVVTETAPGGATSNVGFTWTINHVNRSPVITSVPTGFTVTQGEPFPPLTIVGFDPDFDPAFWTVNGRGVNNGQDLPPSVQIDRTTGVISGTFPIGSDTEYTLSVGLSECASGTEAAPCNTMVLPGEHLATLAGFEVGVLDLNDPADVVNPGPQANSENDTVSLQITASDPEDDELTYTAGGLPPGLSIDSGTGLISGTVVSNSAGSYAVTVLVDDEFNDPASITFVWKINGPPVVAIPNRTNIEGETVAVSLAGFASDPNNDPLTFSAAGLPPGLSMSSAGVVTGSLDAFSSAGTYAVQVTVSDGMATTTASFTWTVENVNHYPELNPANQVSIEGDTVSYTPPASDPDGDVLHFSINGLPPGLTLNESTGLISGTLGPGTAGVYTVNVGVADKFLGVVKTFTWTITNQPPVLTNPGDQTDPEGVPISRQFTATDPENDTLTFTATGLPPGLGISASGLVTGTPPFTAAGVYPVALSVTDGASTRSATFNWTVTNVNRAPDVINPGPQTSNEGAIVTLPIGASDPDGETLSFSAAGLPPGLSIDAAGVIGGTLTYSVAGSYTVTVTAADGTGPGALSDSETFTWTVDNVNLPPIVAADVASVLEGQSVVINVLTNDSDPDGGTLTVTGVSTPSNGTAAVSGGGTTVTYSALGFSGPTATFTYTVSDGQGGSATASVTVAVTPLNVPPVCNAAVASPGVLWPPNHKPVYVTIGGVTDPDGGTPTITFTSIQQDEPTNTQGDGNTNQDGGIGPGGTTAWVRAERMGGENANLYGRVYIIGFTATDGQATCAGTVVVGVPHDQGNHNVPAPSPGRWNSIDGSLVVAPPPVANNDSISLKKGTSQTVTVQSNDVVYGAVTVSIDSAPPQGSVVVNPTGTITYTAPSNWTGSTSFTYRLTNAAGSDTAVVSVTVKK